MEIAVTQITGTCGINLWAEGVMLIGGYLLNWVVLSLLVWTILIVFMIFNVMVSYTL